MKTTEVIAMRRLSLIFIVLMLSACGFHLRGQVNLPFDTLYISGVENTPFHSALKSNIQAGSKTRLTEKADEAQAILQIASVTSEKSILSLGSDGRVREFQLRYRVIFRVHDGKGRDFLPTSDILLTRDFTFSDSQVLSKEIEEGLLYRDMQSDAVRQLFRRLSVAKLQG